MSVQPQINLKFLVRFGKTPTEALKLLQEVYGDSTMSRTCLFEWHRRFKEGREEMEDDHRSGKPSTSRTDKNVEHVKQKVLSDRRLTVRMIADEMGMNSERVWRIITQRAKSTDRDKLTAKQRFCYSDFITDFVTVIS